MRYVVILFLHLIVTVLRLARPGGLRSVVDEQRLGNINYASSIAAASVLPTCAPQSVSSPALRACCVRFLARHLQNEQGERNGDKLWPYLNKCERQSSKHLECASVPLHDTTAASFSQRSTKGGPSSGMGVERTNGAVRSLYSQQICLNRMMVSGSRNPRRYRSRLISYAAACH